MYKHRIVIESNNMQELAQKLLLELTKYSRIPEDAILSKVDTKPLKEDCPLCTSPMVEKKGMSKKEKPYHSKNCTMCAYVEWLDPAK